MNKLKPIVLIQGDKNFYRQNVFAQNLILKALSKGVTNPNELRKIAGLKTVTEVYRTLDKMAIRKVFHEALSRADISLDYIVTQLKSIIDSTESDKVKLSGLTTLLKTLGLDKYEVAEGAKGTWQDAILEAVDKDKKELLPEPIEAEYEVKQPDVPDSVKDMLENEKRLGKQIYE